MKLILAEKPSVARDIARVLGVNKRADGYLYNKDYVVTWAVGHLVALQNPDEIDEKYKKWHMDLLPIRPAKIPLKVLPATRDRYNTIARMMNDAKVTSLVCATDSAREGELIFRYIYEMAGCQKPVERLWISSMTDAAIRQGFDSMKDDHEYDALYDSARCRSEADWLVGMNASRAFSIRYNAHLSVGRVQTPTLSLIVRRDREIADFVPQEYWELQAVFADDAHDFTALWINPAPPREEGADAQGKARRAPDTRIYDKETGERVRAEIKGREGTVVSSTSEKKRVVPPQLFDLTSLQREANNKFGFSADKTLKLTQALYEIHKVLTYPRTDSCFLPDDMAPKVRKVLTGLPAPYAEMVADARMNLEMHGKRYYDDSKISDHHAIVPTEKNPAPGALNADEAKIYDMVVRRLIAAHYPDYEYESAKLVMGVGEHRFRASGAMPVAPGWKSVYAEGEDKKSAKKEAPLPKLQKGDVRKVKSTSLKAGKTKPPVPHTDASLLGMMEHPGSLIEDEALREQMKASGLGTPATRAATIERLIEVGYVRRSGKSLLSTDKGRSLIAIVPPEISDAVTTGRWERALSKLATNKDAEERRSKVDKFMGSIGRFTDYLVQCAQTSDARVRFEKEEFKPVRKKKTAAKSKHE